jgi:hypothetical protein
MLFPSLSFGNVSAEVKYETKSSCHLFEYFKKYRYWLESYPVLSEIKKTKDMQSFKVFASDLTPSKDDKNLSISIENLVWRSVWFDLRISKILRFKETCSNNIGELVFLYVDQNGGKGTDIVLFTLSGAEWLIRAPYLSTTSKLLGVKADVVLENINDNGVDFSH